MPQRLTRGMIQATVLIMMILPFTGKNAQAQQSGLHLVGSPAIQLNVVPQGLASDVAEDRNNSTRLMWGKRKRRSKVTVSTFSPGQKFDLEIEARRTKNGKSTGSIKLVDGMMDTDLIVNINKKKSGSARIRYVAKAGIEQGNTETEFADVHTVTFTITDQ